MGGAGEKIGSEVILFSLQLLDAFLDRIFAEKLMHENRLVLTNPVSAVGRLVLGGRIPPRVIMDDGVCAGQGEACPAGFQRNKKDLTLTTLPAFDE